MAVGSVAAGARALRTAADGGKGGAEGGSPALRGLRGPLNAPSTVVDSAGGDPRPLLHGLTNPTLAHEVRPKFAARTEASDGAAVRAQAMGEGLRHSVLKVQHDNPWATELLAMEAACGEGMLEREVGGAQAARDAELAAELRAAESSAQGPNCAFAQAEDDDDDDADARACLSLHQPWASLCVANIKQFEVSLLCEAKAACSVAPFAPPLLRKEFKNKQFEVFFVLMPLLPPGAPSLRPGGLGCQRLGVNLPSFSVTLR
ncbi:hypothetical protein T492DRAFT_517408 [Pavlovales sp. CCMP2436]|nr:hypothetical protein T492DRAFT_517408 [Pavlovales sp. CCMP2436]